MSLLRTQILGHHGFALSDFGTRDEAIAMADELIQQNCEEFSHPLKVVKSTSGNPMLDRFFYIKSKGRTRTWKQTEEQVLTGKTDVKSRKILEGVTSSLAIMGGSAPSGVKKENEAYEKLEAKVLNLRLFGHGFFPPRGLPLIREEDFTVHSCPHVNLTLVRS